MNTMNEVIGENNDKAPAIVLEISVDPEATAKLQDWEIESNVQGSLYRVEASKRAPANKGITTKLH